MVPEVMPPPSRWKYSLRERGHRWCLLLVALLAALPSPSAAQTVVSGDVYLLTEGGEVRQGAANRVYVLPRVAELAERWTDLCAGQSTAFTEVMRERRAEGERLSTAADDPANADQRGPLLELAAAHARASLDLVPLLIEENARERAEMIQSRAVESAPTGMNARYEVQLEPGEYWLFAEMRLMEESHRWLIPLDIGSGDRIVLDLDNNNLLPGRAFNCESQPFR